MATSNTSSPDNTDFYLKIEGIKGETRKTGLTDYMQITQFNWGGSHTGSFARDEGGASGRFAGSDFHFEMKTNTASPELMTACANGKHFTKATLVCRKSVGDKPPMEYLKVSLSPVLISSFQTGYDASLNLGDAVVVDKIQLNFGKILVEYKANTNEGGAGAAKEGGYDLQLGKTTCPAGR